MNFMNQAVAKTTFPDEEYWMALAAIEPASNLEIKTEIEFLLSAFPRGYIGAVKERAPLATYQLALDGWPHDAIRSACASYIRGEAIFGDVKNPPNPAEIAQAVTDMFWKKVIKTKFKEAGNVQNS